MKKLASILLCAAINAFILWLLSGDSNYVIYVTIGYIAGALVWGYDSPENIRAK